MTSINSANHMASLALRGLDKSSNVMQQAMERLSSGKRINRSADDAAGMGISLVHKAQTMGLGGAVKHAVDAIGVVNSIEGSLATANDLLLRMRELAVQASSDVNVKAERKSIQDEVNQIWDFLETAAIISNCDLIITSDTSVAHLAAGIGKPTWCLLHSVPDWRWGADGEKTFWYPSLRLFRQIEKDNWSEVMDKVKLKLKCYLDNKN